MLSKRWNSICGPKKTTSCLLWLFGDGITSLNRTIDNSLIRLLQQYTNTNRRRIDNFWVLQDDGNFVGYESYITNPDGTIKPQGEVIGATGTAGGRRSSHYGILK